MGISQRCILGFRRNDPGGSGSTATLITGFIASSRQVMAISDRVAKIKGKEITVNTWLDKYWIIQDERLKEGDIKPNTYKQKRKPVDLMRQALSMKPLPAVDASDIAEILDEYKSNGQHRMAQVIRSVLIDVFKEAQHVGEVPPGYNPDFATKQPKRKVTRQRLNIDEWKKIFEIADIFAVTVIHNFNGL